MLCVTMIERIVRNTSRPMSTGRQTLTNASSPTNARSPIVSVAHGSRWPPPPNRTERPPQMPAPRNARRQRSSRSEPNCESSPIATTSSQTIVARGPSRTPSSMTIRGATTSDPSPRSTPSPIRAPASRSAVTLSAGASARNASWSSEARNAGSMRPASASSSNVAGSETPSVETPARIGPAAGADDDFCAAMSASTSFSVMKPRLSIDARSIPWSSASSTAFRVALRSPAAGFGAGFASALASIDASSSAVSATYAIVLPSSTSTSSRVELDDRSGAGRLDLDGRLRRLDDADGLACRHLGAVLDEPLGDEARTPCSRPRA